MSKTLRDDTFGSLRCCYAATITSKWVKYFNLTTQPDPIGELWERELLLEFFGKPEAFTLQLASVDWVDVLEGKHREGQFTEHQRNAFVKALEHWQDIQEKLESILMNAYHTALALIDYSHDAFPPTTDVHMILPMCDGWTLEIPWQESLPRCITLSCHCAWEEEHGFAASFENECPVYYE